MATRSLRRTIFRALKPLSTSPSIPVPGRNSLFLSPTNDFQEPSTSVKYSPFSLPNCISYRSFSSLHEDTSAPAAIDYSSTLQEEEYHRLASSTIHDLLEKLEEYGDSVEIDGFDVDYGNEVLTLKLGSLGTYVINKQTPNRQIWMSSPVSGPSRFDWDENVQAWIYRRTKGNLIELLEMELEQLCGEPICLS